MQELIKFGGTQSQTMTSKEGKEIKKGSGWDVMSDSEISEAFNYFHDKNMVAHFERFMNMTHDELIKHISKMNFISLLLDLQLKYKMLSCYVFDKAASEKIKEDVEEIDGQLYIKEELLDFTNVPNMEEAIKTFGFMNLMIGTKGKVGYFSYLQLKKLIEYAENPPAKKEIKVVNTYLMTDASGYIKIGKSKDIYKRLATLKIGNPTIKIIHFLEKNIEHELHTNYNSKRIIGEWFDLSNEDLLNIIEKYNFKKY